MRYSVVVTILVVIAAWSGIVDGRRAGSRKSSSSSSSSTSSSSTTSSSTSSTPRSALSMGAESSCPLFPKDTPAQIASRALELMQNREFPRSKECYLIALERMDRYDPARASIHHNLGGAYLQTGEYALAAGQFREALLLYPQYESAAVYLATALANSDDSRAAIKAAETALKINPYSFEALTLLGQIQRQQKEYLSAAKTYINAGASLHLGTKKDVSPEAAYAHKYRLSDALVAISQEAQQSGDRTTAKKILEMSREMSPKHFMTLWALARVLNMEMKMAEAIEMYEAARLLLPRNETAELEATLGNAYRATGDPKKAVDCFSRALEVNDEHAAALIGLVMSEDDMCLWTSLRDDRRKTLHNRILNVTATRNDVKPESMSFLQPFYPLSADVSPALALSVAATMANLAYTPERVQSRALMQLRSPVPHGRNPIKIGYLMRCWEQTLFQLTAGILQTHSARYAVHVYWLEPHVLPAWVDAAGEGIPTSRKRDLTNLDDQGAAATINGDGVHILVDMGGYHNRERYHILSWKPAPHQVVLGVGWPGTMGTSAYVQGLVVDAKVAPPEFTQFYAEKLIYLPNSYQSNQHRAYWARKVKDDLLVDLSLKNAARQEAGLPKVGEGVVFCNFNSLSKLDPVTFDAWLTILSRVPNSLLLLIRRPLAAETNLMKRATSYEGGDMRKRIVFVDPMPDVDYHARIGALGDVFLDTRVYNAHTVGSDVLYAHIPVVTMAEEKLVARVGASHAVVAGTSMFVARTMEDYVDVAVRLGMLRLSQGRGNDNAGRGVWQAIERVRDSPLFDSSRWMQHYEAVLGMSLQSRIDGSELMRWAYHIVGGALKE